VKVYLAGPMSGIPDNNFPAFDRAAEVLRGHGHEVWSPADANRKAGFDPTRTATPQEYAEFMREDLRAVIDSDAIALLPGWEHSKGASMEKAVAEITGRQILYLP
jgi:nucleoside 2-deoxyribosyltransferase